MKKHIIFLLFIFFVKILPCISQERYPVTYEQLKEFEGLYEYVNNSTLEIAASPRDTLLYAIISKSRYALKPVGQDLFLNATNSRIPFLRNKSGSISGYVADNDTFKLISKKVFFPKEMWYARLVTNDGFSYKYEQPKDQKDGLQTGDIAKSGLNSGLLTEMMAKIVDGTYQNVHSVLIIKDGKLVFEEYFYEYTSDSLHELRSATKSFISALTGIAIDKKFIRSKDVKVLSYFPNYAVANNSDAKKQITIENLLTNQTGLDCDISNSQSAGDETKMGYSKDWVKFTLDLPMIDKPGGKGMYCSGNVIVLGDIIQRATKRPLVEFAKENLFGPMGITNFKWNFKPDPSSAETFCQVYVRPRDMAKFGLMYLNKGKWNNRQLISSEWVNQSFSKHSAVQNVDYGYLWWIKYLDADGVRYYGKAAQGNGGQRIFIWEEQNLITVITGGNYNMQSPSDELIRKYILPSFNNK